jgi:hypothetical protein
VLEKVWVLVEVELPQWVVEVELPQWVVEVELP